MAAYNKVNVFVADITNKVHDLLGVTPGTDSDACKVYLSNAVPDAELDAVKADLAEIAAGNGYTAGGTAVTNNGTRTTTTLTFSGISLQWVATGGPIGPFRYVALYNDTPVAPLDPLIAWWDYGSAITLSDGETFQVKFNNIAVGSRGNIFTLS